MTRSAGIAEAYRGEFALLGVKLPLRTGKGSESGVLFDAEGRHIATVDVDRERSDADARKIAAAVAVAVNWYAALEPAR